MEIMNSPISLQNSSTSRPLGIFERYLWLSDQHSSKNFVIAAEILGNRSISDWTKAVEALQKRHPLLRSTIVDHDGQLVFRELPITVTPLRLVPFEEWRGFESEMAEALALPISPSGNLMFRIVLCVGQASSMVVFCFHHSIADGISSAFVIRDLLRLLNGESLPPLPLLPPAELLLQSPMDSPRSDQASTLLSSRGPAILLNRDKRLSIQLATFAPGKTARLRERARRENTTVYGALLASSVLAGERVSSEWAESAVRVATPVDIRKVLGAGENVQALYAFPVLNHHVQNESHFWSVARRASQDAASRRNPLYLHETFSAVQGLMDTEPTVSQIRDFELSFFASEMVLSNIGELPFPGAFGDLQLKSFWGPAVFLGVEGEQELGISTIAGTMHLTHASYTPLPGLVTEMLRILDNLL